MARHPAGEPIRTPPASRSSLRTAAAAGPGQEQTSWIEGFPSGRLAGTAR
jgi:hypothetical protein